MSKNIINYSQCWEDPSLLEKALVLNSDDVVLSITSGGDNTLFLLLNNPRKIISLDSNPTQNYLLELKLVSTKILNYNQLLEFIGVRKSSERAKLFEKLRPSLSLEAGQWWAGQPNLIALGLINSGRFEKFLNIFSRYIVPLAHSGKTVKKFISSPSLQAQKEFFEKSWNSIRWRLFFRIITSRFVLKYFARGRGMFDYNKMGVVAREYQKRFEKNSTNTLLLNNYFMHYCLTGKYGDSLPVYLEQNNFSRLKESATQLSIITEDLFDYLQTMPNNTFSKFNLSDIFEALSPERNDDVWKEIIRTSKNGARIAYWNNLVPRSYPPQLSKNIRDEKELAEKLYAKDRVFFYGSFHVNTIIK